MSFTTELGVVELKVLRETVCLTYEDRSPEEKS